MGKNNGKHGKKTELAKWESIMRKLSNEMDKEKQLEKIRRETKK